MNSRRVILVWTLCFLCVIGIVSAKPRQSQGHSFDPNMSLEQTVAWLGKHLTDQHSVVSPDGKSVWSRGVRLVKAKGCTLSYWTTLQTDGSDPVTPGSQVRELWTLDLSSLDADSILASMSDQVRFEAAASSRNAIRTTVFHKETSLSSYSNKKWGYLPVSSKVTAEDLAAGLKNCVELCRQRKQ